MNSELATAPRPIRWWPGVRLLVIGLGALVWVRFQGDWPFQKRNLISFQVGAVTALGLMIWWGFFSRAPRRWRLLGLSIFIGLLGLGAFFFRVRGMTGDMLPIVEFRWKRAAHIAAPDLARGSASAAVATVDFPQFLGPNRDGVLPGPNLVTNWTAHPPEVVWRKPVGPGWSGFSVAGKVCLTQEQRGTTDCVVAYDLFSGAELWSHADPGRYQTVIAGEGPRATPTVVGNRVFACGATGRLNCLDLASGELQWSHDVVTLSGGETPQWGYAASPLVAAGRVVVSAGEGATNSLLAFDAATGKLLCSGGTRGPSYASPGLATLAGKLQILAFNDGTVSGHDPETGATLWEKPWGNGNVVCAAPVVVSSNRVLFSSGYGVGAFLFELNATSTGALEARQVWRSMRMKSKFAHLFARDGNLYGLDDGIFAAVNLADGSQLWKEGRYGHGQGLAVGELYLLMSEAGELILLQPTAAAPNELARFRVFGSKTWNPIALSGNLLLVRNDQEAACLRLKTVD